MSNLKQVGLGLCLYTGDWDECLPLFSYAASPTTAWHGRVAELGIGGEAFRCPTAGYFQTPFPQYSELTIGYNYFLGNYYAGIPAGYHRLSEIGKPTETVMLADSIGSNGAGQWDYIIGPLGSNDGGCGPIDRTIIGRHSGFCNVLWLDSHGSSKRHGEIIANIAWFDRN